MHDKFKIDDLMGPNLCGSPSFVICAGKTGLGLNFLLLPIISFTVTDINKTFNMTVEGNFIQKFF